MYHKTNIYPTISAPSMGLKYYISYSYQHSIGFLLRPFVVFRDFVNRSGELLYFYFLQVSLHSAHQRILVAQELSFLPTLFGFRIGLFYLC